MITYEGESKKEKIPNYLSIDSTRGPKCPSALLIRPVTKIVNSPREYQSFQVQGFEINGKTNATISLYNYQFFTRGNIYI